MKWTYVLFVIVAIVAQVVGNLLQKAKKAEDQRRIREAEMMRQRQLAGGPVVQSRPVQGPGLGSRRDAAANRSVAPPASSSRTAGPANHGQTLAEQRRAQIEQLRRRRAAASGPGGQAQGTQFGLPQGPRSGSATTPFPVSTPARARGPVGPPKPARISQAAQIKSQRLGRLEPSKQARLAKGPPASPSAPAPSSGPAKPDAVVLSHEALAPKAQLVEKPRAISASIAALRAGRMSHAALRDYFIMKEILDPPVSLR